MIDQSRLNINDKFYDIFILSFTTLQKAFLGTMSDYGYSDHNLEKAPKYIYILVLVIGNGIEKGNVTCHKLQNYCLQANTNKQTLYFSLQNRQFLLKNIVMPHFTQK